MTEEVNEPTITPTSGVRLSVGLLAFMALSFAYFLYARDDFYANKYEIKAKAHEQSVTKDIEEIRQRIQSKAEKSDAADRFTGSDFRTYKANKEAEDELFREYVRLQFSLTEKKNEVEHSALHQQIEHLDDDLRDAIDRIDNHYNMRALTQ